MNKKQLQKRFISKALKVSKGTLPENSFEDVKEHIQFGLLLGLSKIPEGSLKRRYSIVELCEFHVENDMWEQAIREVETELKEIGISVTACSIPNDRIRFRLRVDSVHGLSQPSKRPK